MKFRVTKARVAALGLTLGLSTIGGVALAVEDPATWYTGGNATVADPNKATDVSLKLYDSAGTEVTSGAVSQPLAAYAAANGVVRAGDQFGTLFVHLPQTGTAPGAWPGVQATGTDQFAGAPIGGIPGSLTGKPLVRTNASGDYTLANIIAGLPNNESAASYAGVYELRLRTSSPTGGVSDKYAAGYIKVTGSSWAVTTGPHLGDTGTPPATPVGTSVAPTWPSTLTYGSAASVSVTVNPASGTARPSGTVRLVKGSTTLSTATLSSAGTANLSLSATALTPGSQSLKVVYPGVAGAFNASESAVKTITVAKATPGQPTFKLVKAPKANKKGSGTVTVASPGGLAAAGGTAQVLITKGKVTKTVTVTIVKGTATVKLPKLTPGKWKLTVTYQGDSNYLTSTSQSYKIKVKKIKKK